MWRRCVHTAWILGEAPALPHRHVQPPPGPHAREPPTRTAAQVVFGPALLAERSTHSHVRAPRRDAKEACTEALQEPARAVNDRVPLALSAQPRGSLAGPIAQSRHARGASRLRRRERAGRRAWHSPCQPTAAPQSARSLGFRRRRLLRCCRCAIRRRARRPVHRDRSASCAQGGLGGGQRGCLLATPLPSTPGSPWPSWPPCAPPPHPRSCPPSIIQSKLRTVSPSIIQSKLRTTRSFLFSFQFGG